MLRLLRGFVFLGGLLLWRFGTLDIGSFPASLVLSQKPATLHPEPDPWWRASLYGFVKGWAGHW